MLALPLTFSKSVFKFPYSDLVNFDSWFLHWIQNMMAFNNRTPKFINSEAAIDIANSSQCLPQTKLDAIIDTDLAVGDSVEVLPIDYGFQATHGELVVASPSAIVIKRHDE